MTETLLDPLRYYKTEGSQTHAENTNRFFDNLVRQSGIDVTANQTAAKDYEEQLKQCSQLQHRRTLWILGCAGCVFLALLGVGTLFLAEESIWFLIAAVLLIWLGCACLLSSQLPGFQANSEQLREARETAQQMKDRAAEQLAPLDRQFTGEDSVTLFQQTVPGFSFLDQFTPEHQARLQSFGFREDSDEATSVRGTLAGTYNGSPFLFTSKQQCTMTDVTYTGSTTITWEEQERRRVRKTRTVTDKDGNQREETYYEWEYVTVQRSQTLHAEYTAPKPCYSTHTDLGFGHHAAPNLSFSRSAGKCHELSEAALQAKIRSGERQLIQKGARALKRGEDFTPMVNETFDVLFGAHDRDNSHQFLQLFTPAAQTNLVALMTDDTLGGDGFCFRKNGQYNTVSCADFLPMPSPLHYHDYSLEKAREQFLSHHGSHFRSMFACFAPLLAIPAYQEPALPQHTCDPVSDSLFTRYEHESIANAFPAELAAPANCETETIRKTQFLSTADGADLVRVHTHGFTTRSRTETFRIRGGDGYCHDVDVDWTEYIPVSKTITISIRAAEPDTASKDEPGTVRLHKLTAKRIDTTQEESL